MVKGDFQVLVERRKKPTSIWFQHIDLITNEEDDGEANRPKKKLEKRPGDDSSLKGVGTIRK